MLRTLIRRLSLALISAGLLLLFLLVALYLFGPLRHAKLGLIDDHEILRYLGSRRSIAFSDIPNILMQQTEVGKWGTAGRFRPIYYLFRIFESALWRDNAALWYLTRVALLALSATMVAFVALRSLWHRGATRRRIVAAVVLAIIAGLLTATMPAWLDIATRLGPSEIYVAFGVGVFAIGATEVWRRPGSLALWIVTVFGYLIIVGSKEDGILFAVPLVALVLLRISSSRHRVVVAAITIIALAFTVFVALGVMLGTAATGEDIYGNKRGLEAFSTIVSSNIYVLSTLVFLAITVVIERFSSRTANAESLQTAVGDNHSVGKHRSLRGSLTALALWADRHPATLVATASLYVVLADAYFYQSNYDGIGGANRYGLLTDLSVVTGLVTVISVVFRIPARPGRASRITRPLATALLLVVLANATPPLANTLNADTYRAISTTKAANYLNTSANISTALAKIAGHDNVQVVLVAAVPYDYEPLFSLPYFLRFYGGIESVTVRAEIPTATYAGVPYLKDLADQISSMATNGDHANGWRIDPAATLDASKYTVCLYFNSSPGDLTGCDAIQQIP